MSAVRHTVSVYTSCSVALFGIALMYPWTAAYAQTPVVDTAIYADNQEGTYSRCLTTADVAPEAGLDMALRWIRLGGGEPAQHCAAAALIGLGDPEEAANRLENLAQASTSRPQVKSGLWAHAGRAWMDAGDYSRAETALSQALTLHDGDSTVYIDRALCHAALDDLWSSIDDLNRVIDRHPDAVEALVLRSSAYRQLDIADLAGADIQRVLRLDPNNVDALLESGLIQESRGETDRARKTWMRVLELAPDSVAGDAVRSHLERLDLKVTGTASE